MRIRVAKIRSKTKKEDGTNFKLDLEVQEEMKWGIKLKTRFTIRSSSIFCIIIGPNTQGGHLM